MFIDRFAFYIMYTVLYCTECENNLVLVSFFMYFLLYQTFNFVLIDNIQKFVREYYVIILIGRYTLTVMWLYNNRLLSRLSLHMV